MRRATAPPQAPNRARSESSSGVSGPVATPHREWPVSDYLAASVRITTIKHLGDRPPGRNVWVSESRTIGSGTIVYSDADASVIVGCSHQFDSPFDEILIEGTEPRTQRSEVSGPTFRHSARLLARDDENDLSILQIARGGLPAIPPATWTAALGQRIYAVGCRGGSMPRGALTSTAAFFGDSTARWENPNVLEILADRQHGDSGGGWFAHGSLVAVCAGHTDRHGLGHAAPAIIALLHRAGCVRPAYSAILSGSIDPVESVTENSKCSDIR